jgi:hypothetical protein
MVLSSDKLSGLGKPILQLKLDTAVESNATTSGIQEHLVELDAKELDYLLNSLKAARAVINNLFSTSFSSAMIVCVYLINLACGLRYIPYHSFS